jgi:hypothetical protein
MDLQALSVPATRFPGAGLSTPRRILTPPLSPNTPASSNGRLSSTRTLATARARLIEGQEIEISGTRDELRAAAEQIRRVALGRSVLETIVQRGIGPMPGEDGTDSPPSDPRATVRGDFGVDLEVEVRQSSDPIRVRVEPGIPRVLVRGGISLLHLAAWLDVIGAEPGREVRLEEYRGHPYLAEGSPPLIVRHVRSRVQDGSTPVDRV